MDRKDERKRTADEVSKTEDDVETGDQWLPRDERWGDLPTASAASGV